MPNKHIVNRHIAVSKSNDWLLKNRSAKIKPNQANTPIKMYIYSISFEDLME